MTTSHENEILNKLRGNEIVLNKSTETVDFLIDNYDMIKSHAENKKAPKINAFDRLVRPRMDVSKKIRKGSKQLSVDPKDNFRRCECNEILSFAQHTCTNCALVQEVHWEEMPTMNEMKYKLKTHTSFPCASDDFIIKIFFFTNERI